MKVEITRSLYCAYQQPSRTGLIAGHFDKGDIVEVEEVIPGWGRLVEDEGWLPLWDTKEVKD